MVARLKVCEGDLRKLPQMQDHDGALAHIFQVSQEMNDSFRKLVEGAYSAADHPDKHVAARLQDMNSEFPLKVIHRPCLYFKLYMVNPSRYLYFSHACLNHLYCLGAR